MLDQLWFSITMRNTVWMAWPLLGIGVLAGGTGVLVAVLVDGSGALVPVGGAGVLVAVLVDGSGVLVDSTGVLVAVLVDGSGVLVDASGVLVAGSMAAAMAT